jgi:hypothetical protein
MIIMPKVIVSFTLSPKTLEKLDKYAKMLGVNRSALLEWLLELAYGRLEPNINGLLDTFKEVSDLRKKVVENTTESKK